MNGENAIPSWSPRRFLESTLWVSCIEGNANTVSVDTVGTVDVEATTTPLLMVSAARAPTARAVTTPSRLDAGRRVKPYATTPDPIGPGVHRMVRPIRRPCRHPPCYLFRLAGAGDPGAGHQPGRRCRARS